jgi:hypothetical protein
MKRVLAVLAFGIGSAVMASLANAQAVTGTPFLSNINPSSVSFSNDWKTPPATVTSTPTGLEINAPGGTGSFSTAYYGLPNSQITPLNPADTQVTFNYLWNSGNAVAGVNVLFALDDSLGGSNYYGTGYIVPTPGLNSFTFPLQAANQANVAAGAVIAGLNFQIDPANVSGNYDITFSSLTLGTVPEPASLSVLGLGSLLALRRRRRDA